MKRLFMMAFMTIIATVTFAANPLKVVNGDKKFFKNAEGTVFLEVIYDESATFDDKMPLTEKYDNMEEKTTISYNGFIEEFSERNKKLQFVKNEEEATYKITIKVTKVDEIYQCHGLYSWSLHPCLGHLYRH